MNFAKAFFILAGSISAAVAYADEGEHYAVVKKINIEGDLGWDYLSVDSAARRLYVSHGDHVAVLDVDSGTLVGTIADTPGVHGIAIAPELKRGYVSSGKANSVRVFDLNTLKSIAVIPTGENPDAIVYEPVSHHVLTFNGRGQSISVIDIHSNTVIDTIRVAGKPEFARADGQGQVFFNVENTSELAVFDSATDKITARYPLKSCTEPSGLAIDIAHKRLFSVCDNQTMAIVDAASGATLTTLPIGSGVDGVEFDAQSQNAFSANGQGTLTVVHEIDPDHFVTLQTLQTQRGARTIALDQKTHTLFLPTAEFGSPGPAAPDQPAARPPIFPGTFHVLEVRPVSK